jgi:hypothetical protein
MPVRCSWVHCEAFFDGCSSEARVAGWALVACHVNTGEQVVVCSVHAPELLEADLRALLRLFEAPGSFRGVPRVSYDEDEPAEDTRRVSKGRVEVK